MADTFQTEFKVKLKLGEQPEHVIALGTVNLPVEGSGNAALAEVFQDIADHLTTEVVTDA